MNIITNARQTFACFRGLYGCYRGWGMTRRRAFYHAADCAVSFWTIDPKNYH